jgi:hypothetical protein
MTRKEKKKTQSRNVRCFSALWLRIVFTVSALLSVAGLVDAFLDTQWLLTVAFFIVALAFSWLAWGYWKNPIIEMNDVGLEVHTPIEYVRSTVSIPWEDMTGIVWQNPKTICVRLGGGGTHTLYLSQLGTTDRERVHREVLEKAESK